jgi:hypothetical protein
MREVIKIFDLISKQLILVIFTLSSFLVVVYKLSPALFKFIVCSLGFDTSQLELFENYEANKDIIEKLEIELNLLKEERNQLELEKIKLNVENDYIKKSACTAGISKTQLFILSGVIVLSVGLGFYFLNITPDIDLTRCIIDSTSRNADRVVDVVSDVIVKSNENVISVMDKIDINAEAIIQLTNKLEELNRKRF